MKSTIYVFLILVVSACSLEEEDKYQRNTFLTHSIHQKYSRLNFYQSHIPTKAKIALELAHKIKGISDTCYLMLSYYSSTQILNYIENQGYRFPLDIKSTIDTSVDDMSQFGHVVNAERIQILENEILHQIMNILFQTDLKFIDEFAVIPREKSKTVQYGDAFLADVFLIARCSTCPIKIVIDELDWKDTLVFDNSELPHIKVEKEHYHRGTNELKPKYIFKTDDGEIEAEFRVKFEVK